MMNKMNLHLPDGKFTQFPLTLLVLLILLIPLICTCTGSNVLSEFAKKDTNEALLKAAKIHINKSEWSEAIARFGEMTSDYLAQREVKVIEASAYGGRCGLNLVNLAEGLSGTLTSLLFRFLMQQYPGATTTNRDDCVTAETILKSIDTNAANRTTDENLLMIFISFAKIGVTLSAHADSVLVDGAPDAGWNSCTNNASNFPDASVREVGTGIALALTSLSAISSSSTIASGQLTNFTDVCTTIASVNASYDFCSVTVASDFTALQLKAIRSLVGANEYVGIGSCNNTLLNCLCP